MIIPVTVSTLFSIILFIPFSYGVMVEMEQSTGGVEMSSSLMKKIQKLIDLTSSCVETMQLTGGFSDSCIRFHVAANLGLAEIFQDNQTKQDIDKILYG